MNLKLYDHKYTTRLLTKRCFGPVTHDRWQSLSCHSSPHPSLPNLLSCILPCPLWSCHPTEVVTPRRNPAIQSGTRFTYPGGTGVGLGSGRHTLTLQSYFVHSWLCTGSKWPWRRYQTRLLEGRCVLPASNSASSIHPSPGYCFFTASQGEQYRTELIKQTDSEMAK